MYVSELSSQITKFEFVTVQDPSALARILEYFIIQDFIPAELRARQIGTCRLSIELVVVGLSPRRCGIIADKIRSLPVTISAKYQAASTD